MQFVYLFFNLEKTELWILSDLNCIPDAGSYLNTHTHNQGLRIFNFSYFPQKFPSATIVFVCQCEEMNYSRLRILSQVFLSLPLVPHSVFHEYPFDEMWVVVAENLRVNV